MELLQISVTVYFSLGVSSKERLKVLYLLEKKKKKRKKRLLYFNFRPVVLDLIRGRRFFERGAY